MPTAYPGALDAFNNPAPGDSQAVARTHTTQHADANDAIEALQAALGTTGSAGTPISLRADLASTSDAAKGAALLGYNDPLAPAFLKTVSDIINGERVSVLRNIAPSKWAAVRDGTNTDNLSSNFADLLSAMSTAGRGELFVPRGTYNLNTGQLAIPANVTLRGENRRGTLLKFGTGGGQNGLAMQAAGAEVHGLTVDGTTVVTSCFLVDNVSDVVLCDVEGRNAASHGFALTTASKVQMSMLRAISCGSRGVLIDPNSSLNTLDGLFTDACTNAGLLIGHASHSNVLSNLVLTNTGNSALWVHQGAYRNTIRGVRIRGTTNAGTPAVWFTQATYDNTLSDFSIESYNTGIQLNAGVADTGITAGHTRRNVIGRGRIVGNGTGVEGGSAIRFESTDTGTTYALNNQFSNIVATDFALGLYDANGNGAIGNDFADMDLSTNVTTPFSLALTTSQSRVHAVKGINGGGFISSPPAVAASGTAVTNSYPYAVTVYVKGLPGGSNVQINGAGVDPTAAPNDGNGPHRLEPQQTITLIYGSGTPTWRWFGQ